MKEITKYACPICHHSPLVRVHKDGNIFCNNCDEPLLRDVNDYSLDKYITCPNKNCGYYGSETMNPKHGAKCIRCGANLL